ncbi:hypothetical protein C8A00DRAFT_34433 [Chaetomidium leptoderma]|uniref:HTH psq-type domain-containing protein n=1 Tax=Chaetomidium leptoderma TaxID=669021 RepID=A0AAN6ZWM5_9PEZI|nr:hypothetical protein C8A00DRAFT_34433 [Chaetomidium leptoderma]
MDRNSTFEIPPNLSQEERVCRAVEAFRHGEFKVMTKAARSWQVPYDTLRSRLKGAAPRAQNGGHSAKMTAAQEITLHAWLNIEISLGS